jgi:hypothetical protein
MRQGLSFIPTIVFGLTWIHILSVVLAAASLSVQENKFLAKLTTLTYSVLLLVDGGSIAAVCFYPDSFPEEYSAHAVAVQSALLCISFVLYIVFTFYVGFAVRGSTNRFLMNARKWKSAELALEMENRETRRAFVTKYRIGELWPMAVGLWILFVVIFNIRNIIKLSPRVVHVFTIFFYGLSWPFIAAVVGPAGKSKDPEPYVKYMAHPAVVGAFVSLSVGALACIHNFVIILLQIIANEGDLNFIEILDIICASSLFAMIILNLILIAAIVLLMRAIEPKIKCNTD